LQRDRNPDHYLDDAHYESRPSVWVELLDGWKDGMLELVELPTDDEQHDNISVFWKPETPPKAGDPIHLHYRLHWSNSAPFPSQLARCVATRIGQEGWDGSRRQAEIYRFSVEFEGDVLARFGPDESGATPDIKAVHATVEDALVERVPGTKRWRVVFGVKLLDKEPADLRLAIRTKAGVVSETWSYRFKPD
jgi:glucans biosynthesis protein